MIVVTVCAVVLALVALRWTVRHIRVRNMVRRVDELHHSVAAWQSIHRDRMIALDHQMSEIEQSVARAEDSARLAARNMAEITGTLKRLERLEHRAEIELLVAQGRIPREHTSATDAAARRRRRRP
ncbi:MAG TPA: hypothetical protein VGO78_17745 [Acidimicrobiales bacterium]|jgi:hypothetical protein|nr:hypothetical protein [Acidimicrobiales bacterium]